MKKENYDTKEVVAKSITSIEALVDLISKRRKAYFEDESLEEFYILGRFRLDRRGGFLILRQHILKEIFPDIPDVLTEKEMKDYVKSRSSDIEFYGSGLDVFHGDSIEVIPGLKCPVCGVVWDINNLHEAVVDRNTNWLAMKEYAGLTIDEAIDKLNDRRDGVYSLGPSDHCDPELILHESHSLWVSTVKLIHQECKK